MSVIKDRMPQSRDEYKEWCLRSLGKPVIEINVDEQQVEDCVNYALKTWWDYHFDGSEKIYYKYAVTANNRPGVISDVDIIDGGTGYANGETLTFNTDGAEAGGTLTEANAFITTNANGTITGVTFNDRGYNYPNDPSSVTINTVSGSNAQLNAFNGGYVPLPENIIGAVNIFDIGYTIGTNNIFNIRYQIALNDLYTLTSVSLVPYFMAFQHIQFLEYMLVGRQPIRYVRHKDRLYMDLDWEKFAESKYVVIEAYQVVDPNVYTEAWGDRWLLNYGTQLIKRAWGNNLKKFPKMQLTGGITFSGQQIYDEAQQEIAKLEERLIIDYSVPVLDMIG